MMFLIIYAIVITLCSFVFAILWRWAEKDNRELLDSGWQMQQYHRETVDHLTNLLNQQREELKRLFKEINDVT